MGDKALRYAGQALMYAAFAAVIGILSTAPVYRHLAPDQGLLRLSFKHAGKFKVDCRSRSAEELSKMPAQLRTELDCPRERSPVHVRVELDGRALYDESFAPAGLRKDGAASGYHRLPISAGAHRIRVQVNDDVRVKGFNYEREERVNVRPGQVVLLDFVADRGGVLIK